LEKKALTRLQKQLPPPPRPSPVPCGLPSYLCIQVEHPSSLLLNGEALAGIMTVPFYRELGFSREVVGGISGGFGLFAVLAGALAGGWLVARIGTGRALVLTGLTQMLSNLMYLLLLQFPGSLPMLTLQVGVENFTDGLADAAFLTYLSSLTARNFTATQYALLSSLASVPLRTLGGSSGLLAAGLGWGWFFVLTTLAALPALAMMLWLLR
jgi:PAT family beta-lactamase induction signal transducer AmpG